MLRRISRRIQRLERSFCFVDLVRTSAGLIRVGGMPGLERFFRTSRSRCEHVVVLSPLVTMSGDDHAGEEEILWNEFHAAKPRTRTYIGDAPDVYNLMRRVRTGLGLRSGPEPARWADDPLLRGLVRPLVVPPLSRSVRLGRYVEIRLAEDNVEIIDGHEQVYDRRELQPSVNVSYGMERLFEGMSGRRRFGTSASGPAVLPVGCGNYVSSGRPSFLVAYGRRIVWLDPCAYPLENLALNRVPADAVTDILLSQAGDDHAEGLPALLKRAKETRGKINLVTTPAVFADLRTRLSYLFPGRFEKLINFVKVTPLVTLPYHKGQITVRQNLSFSRKPPLGVRIGFNGAEVSFSGDTCYDENAAAAMARPDLGWRWFRDSGLVFHEAGARDPGQGHTRYRDLLKLKKKLNGAVYVYRAGGRRLFPAAFCREGMWYELRRDKVRVRKTR